MALFKIKKGLKTNLPSTYNEGYCYFTTDDGKFYIDTNDTESGRVVLNAYKADQLATSRTIRTNLASTSTASFNGTTNITPGVTGTLAPANGGTGETSLNKASNALLNALTTGSTKPIDTDYYISQFVGGGDVTTTYHRRPMSSLWNYIKGKTDTTYLQLSGGTITGTLIAKSIAVKDTYGIYQFRDSNDVISAAILANTTDHQIYFYHRNKGDDIYSNNESFWLPKPDLTQTGTKSYQILTTKNLITVAQGGTGVNNINDARHNLTNLGADVITTTANDTVAKWGAYKGLGFSMYTKTGQLNDQPSQYGLLLNIGHSTSEIHQLWLTQSHGNIYHRGGNASGWGTQSWVTMLDSNNYNTYVPKKDGTGASGTWGISISGTAAKATALATARTFQIADNDATNKGPTVSFNGSANIILNLPSTIKASLSGNASTASQLGAYSTAGEYTKNSLAYFNTSTKHSGTAQKGVNDGPTTTDTWWHFLRFTHSNGAGYYTDLAIPFNDNSIYYKRISNGSVMNSTTNAGWVQVLDASNYTSYCAKASHSHSYLPLSGGTLTGLLSISTNNKYVTLGCQNESFAHYSTDAGNGHWFNKAVYVQGDIYCGSSYNTKVYTVDGGALSNTAQIIRNGRSTSWISGRDTAIVRANTYNNYSAGLSMKTANGSWEIGVYTDDNMWFTYASDANYNAGTNSVTQFRASSAGVIYGAAWNDYAEYRQGQKEYRPGTCVIEVGDDTLIASTERLQSGALIVSDTFGFAIGETDEAKTPIATSGRVLAYTFEPRESYSAGDPVCSGPNGTISKMTEQEVMMYPHKMIGTVSAIPDYEEWGTGKVKVDGRIWIQVR